ncbi:MAG TPA: DUF2167 domain-containing protein [Chitinophagales bacterium]|nr:DUF2167 domain-containing protein [Chitinophagales bacterium]
MKNTLSLPVLAFAFLMLTVNTLFAADADTAETINLDSVHLRALHFDTTGSVEIGGVAKFEVPKGFKFLNAEDSKYVLHNLWGNPPSDETLGMIFPSYASDVIPATWAIEITYDESGHVKDDDAKDINYADLLKEMQKSVEESNPERKKQGYPTAVLLGWAEPPYYDAENKKLLWAKRIKFESDTSETLNYNIRVLGRKGVLVLNGIGTMEDLEVIKSSTANILPNMNFTDGNKYTQFDSNLDKVAAYGIGGLIAGGVLMKTGLLAKIGILLLKFIKPILVGAAAIGSAVWRFITGKNKDDQS